MARVKPITLETRADFDAAIDEVAVLEVKKKKLEAERDAEIQEITQKYEVQIVAIENEQKLKLKLAEEYAKSNRSAILPKSARSARTAQATFGFRLGNPTVKELNKQWTWTSIIAALKAGGKPRYIRLVEEVDKEKVRAEMKPEEMAAFGMRVTQTDKFFAEPLVETGTRISA